MKKQWRACAALFLLSFSTLTRADEPGSILESNMPRADLSRPETGFHNSPDMVFSNKSMLETGLFVEIGGSYNSIKLDQQFFASGVSDIFSDGVKVSSGEAGGPANPFIDTQSTLAPTVQIGYLRNDASSNHLCGVKVSYKYLGLNFTDDGINSLQIGEYTNTDAAPADTDFTGHVIIGSYQTLVNHELALMPFWGRSFEQGYVYFGAGPVVFQTTTRIYQAIGYADLNGVHTDITGTPFNFSDSNWMWGGVAQVGMVYDLGYSWSVDLSYEIAVTGRYSNNNFTPFNSASQGYTDSGTLYIDASQRLTAQSLAFSITKMF